jgi:hypothetical protein
MPGEALRYDGTPLSCPRTHAHGFVSRARNPRHDNGPRCIRSRVGGYRSMWAILCIKVNLNRQYFGYIHIAHVMEEATIVTRLFQRSVSLFWLG